MKKLKEYLSTNEFKASLWTFICTFVLALPFIILFVISMTQFSYITKGFWLIILIFAIILVLIFALSNIIYMKLCSNYENTHIDKNEYKKTFTEDLLKPICLGTVIVVLLVYLDQISKISAIKNLTLGEPVVFIKYLLNWTLAYNKGAAWSMCSEHTNVLAIISLIASLILTFFMKDFNVKKKPLYSIGIAFMLGGTIGNMIDRFLRVDGVIDFIELGFMDFPIFNLADSFLVVGTIMLMVSIVFSDIINLKKDKELNGDNHD